MFSFFFVEYVFLIFIYHLRNILKISSFELVNKIHPSFIILYNHLGWLKCIYFLYMDGLSMVTVSMCSNSKTTEARFLRREVRICFVTWSWHRLDMNLLFQCLLTFLYIKSVPFFRWQSCILSLIFVKLSPILFNIIFLYK